MLRRRIPFLVALLPLVVLIGGGRATSTSVTFTPVAYAYVSATTPTSNAGTSTSIRLDGSPIVRSYLSFSVANVSGPVGQAVLRVYANSSQNKGYSVYAVADTSWSEKGITYANAPPFADTASGASGRVTAGTWTSVDVTSLVKGNGTYSLGLATSSPTALSLASREAGANAPQLVVSITSTQAPPANTAPPGIAGSPQQGQPSSADPGTWSGSPSSFGYRWRLCPSATDASTCQDITGATAQSYTPVQGDVGGYLRVDVTATNGGGTSLAAESAAAGPVAAINPPANTAPPGIAGSPQQGQPSSADPGTWSGSPSSFGYRWRLCPSATDASTCQDITGATAQSYTPVQGDVGGYLRVDVTATNGGGTSLAAESAAAGPVAAINPPANTTPPAVTGIFEVGRLLQADRGSWSGNPTSYGYTWRVCNSATDASACADIVGQQGQTYMPQATDIGSYLRVRVTATNGGFHADVVLNGHDHEYERFAPQTPAGAPDAANGIREFVAGTGGKSQASFAVVQPNSEIRSSGTYGVLLLTLHPGGYDWQFVAEAGKSFSDSGSGSCH